MALSAVLRLGLEIRRARMARGLSQRKLAIAVGLAAHSNIGDYERGERLAPLDIISACEQALHLPPAVRQQWHAAALAERADQWFDAQTKALDS